MLEIKSTVSKTINKKGLTIGNGKIVDADGFEKDLNKIVMLAFNDGDCFDFTVKSKDDDVKVIDEDGE